MRIAYARIAQETNAFSPEPSTLEHFKRLHWLEGDALARVCGPRGAEIENLIGHAELSGVVRAITKSNRRNKNKGQRPIEGVPLFSAWALPGGPISDASVVAFRDKLVASIKAAGPLDGLVLVLHGAMRGTANFPEPEDTFLMAAQDALGVGVPIAVTYDLHANMTATKATLPAVIAAYRTNPHWDLASTGVRATRMLIRIINGRLVPTASWRKLPMVMGGGTTLDFAPPMLGVFARMRSLEVRRKVVDTSLFMAHIWNDSDTLGWATYAVTNDDQSEADRIADDLADRAWATRHVKPPPMLGAVEAVKAAREAKWSRRAGTVCLSDIADNTSAGATGESTHLLRAFMEHAPDLRCLVAVRDEAAVQEAWTSGVRAQLDLTVGGVMSPELYPPQPLRGRVTNLSETPHYGRCATLRVLDSEDRDTGISCVLTDRAPLNLKPSFWRANGLRPGRADMVAVKSIFHFRIYYAGLARKIFPVMTPGVTNIDLWKTVDYRRPTFPRDDVKDWRTA